MDQPFIVFGSFYGSVGFHGYPQPEFRNRVMTVQYVDYLQFGAFVVKSLLLCTLERLCKNSGIPLDEYFWMYLRVLQF